MQPQMSAGYELSPQQKQVFAQKQENATAGIALLLEGSLALEKLRLALGAVLERHESLRCTYQRRPGMKFPFQVVRDRVEVSWNELDLSSVARSEQNSHIEGLLRSSTGVNTENGPVVSATLVKLGLQRHALTLAFPSLAVDHASLNVIRSEFSAYYAGTPMSGEILQYPDYSEWQHELLRGDDESARQAAQFWKESSLLSLPSLSMPFERKRGNAEAGWNSVQLSFNPLWLRKTPAEIENFLFACWQIFLWRMSGQPEFSVGYYSSGRNHEEFLGAVGIFAKLLPVRADFSSNRSFSEFLEESHRARARALEWQDYFSSEQVNDTLAASFDFLACAEPSSSRTVELIRYVPAQGGYLQLRAMPRGDCYETALLFNPSRFQPDVVLHFAEIFSTLCRGALENPALEINALPVTSEDERQRVIVAFNRTAAEYPQDKCVHHLFEECATKYPERPALCFGDRLLTFAELDREANRIAHVLRQHGVSSNLPVALCVERSAEMIIALLGILKAGACYLPLVPDTPKNRLAHQIQQAGSPLILTQASKVQNLPEFKGKTILLDADRELIARAPDSSPAASVSAHDLAYVIYTSGSTGTPKGVAVRHSNLVNYSQFICRRLGIDQQHQGWHFATVSTIAADLGNTCIFPSLISGGCLHVIGFEQAMSPALFAEYASRHPIDVLKITPSHLASLLQGDHAAQVLPRKRLVLGGETVRWDLVKRVRKFGHCSIFNHYGPTEATVGCCTFSVDEVDVRAWEPSTVPIGQPIANDRVYVLDERMRPVPVGVAGELYIGGAGIAQGYLNQPQQTAERFIPDPFSAESNARLYRTGDLARFLPDGNLEFLGRIDQQVKIRGFRVEPAEIETVLRLHPGVKQAAIVPFEDKAGEKRLAAYVVGGFRNQELVSHLAQYLPDYMVPSALIVVPSLPLTPNGKIDLRALPSPQVEVPAREQTAPRNDDEEKLAQIWQQVLKLERVGVTDNFFELGGHSLLATQIISRIRNQFRVQMPLQVFLQNPTIAQVASEIDKFPAVESEKEEIARIINELEGLSEEDAEKLLAAEIERGDTHS
jgi:amino acid adenylation domain-containing protein